MLAFASSLLPLPRPSLSPSHALRPARSASIQLAAARSRFISAPSPGVTAIAPRKRADVAMVRKVNGEELEKVLGEEDDTPMIIDFYATWCGPCQFLGPELEKLGKLYGERLRIFKVDTEEEEEVASSLRIRGLPTLFFVQGGQVKYKMEGALPASELANICDQLFFGKVVPE